MSPSPSQFDPAPLFDSDALVADLKRLAVSGDGDSAKRAIVQRLKAVLAESSAKAEAMLLEDRQGGSCAARLCRMQDDIIRVIYTFAVTHLHPSNIPENERMAIVATGGYGRGLMAPGSDIDLLFVLPHRQSDWDAQITETMLYGLWDMGLKVGHATRSIDDCIRLSREDMTIRTAILEARFLLGNRALFDEMIERFDRQVVQGTAAEFVAAKMEEREQRHRRSGQSRYLVEPNVKDGKGGLRDLHTLFWTAKYVYRARDPEDLIAAGAFNRAEYRLFRRCEDYLWAVRCNMHFVAGRAEERLSFDTQRAIARRLGYVARAGLRDVERFMKHYFLVAKNVGDLTAILCAKLESRQAKIAPTLSLDHTATKAKPRVRRPLRESADFVVDNNRINVADPDVFARDPVNLIRMFRLAQRHVLPFHPDALHAATRSLRLIDKPVRENRQANDLFCEILTSRTNAEIVLRRMNEAGVLGRFVPEFGRVVSMMQFNMYHHYTVDEHLLRCIGVLTEIETGANPEYGLANDLIRTIQPGNREVLHIALFCHDIAKGRVEDHSIAGTRVARELCARLGCSPGETETVAWLVENHLVMSTLAQSRDLSDRKTIENFAAIVQSLERMKLLTILTTADIRAVGPGVWNGWKSQLLRALYYETEPVLTGGFSEVDRARRVAIAQAEFRIQLADWPEEELDRYTSRLYPAYWLKVEPLRRVAHARFVHAAQREGRSLATDVGFDAARGVTEITVLAPDHPWLLSYLAGACATAGANIVNAQIYTTTDGMALDTISISREFEMDEDEKRRADRIAASIEEASRLDLRLPEAAVKKRLPKGRFGAFAVEPEVIINNHWSNHYTVIEISGLDRPGLLFDLTAALSRLNLNIASAHVATFGERAVDVFYVTDLLGAKVFSPGRNAAIKRALMGLFTPPPANERAASLARSTSSV
jgi:[protein-PII] uridylyltransferase